MKTLYKLLLNSKYQFVRDFGDKAFTFKETFGDWEKQFTISKYGRKYEVKGFEGTNDFIKTFYISFDTYQEVAEYLGI